MQTTVALTPDLEAPIAKGAVIGKVVATAGGKPFGEAPSSRWPPWSAPGSSNASANTSPAGFRSRPIAIMLPPSAT